MGVIANSDQQISLQLTFTESGLTMVMTAVYANCDAGDRQWFWTEIYHLHNNMSFPWLVGGDFNVILDAKEKIGGLPVLPQE